MAKLPKDLYAAEAAYLTYFNNQPQVNFLDTSHEYQMRWVRIARAVVESFRSYSGPGAPNGQWIGGPTEDTIDDKDNFWRDVDTIGMTKPEKFLAMYVKKEGKRYNWKDLPVDRRKAAKLVNQRMMQRRWKAKKRPGGVAT